MDRITLYFATRNRPHFVERTLQNLSLFLDDADILIANCSSAGKVEETSKIIDSYKSILNVREFLYEVDPGVALAYNDLFQKVQTSLSVIWSDDMLFLREIDNLIEFFRDDDVRLVALPMIDDISGAKSIQAGWPKDRYGCAVWDTPSGRCSNHTIVRQSHFAEYDNIWPQDEMIDQFFHNHTKFEQRIWPDDGPYVVHTRIDDETRLNMILDSSINRFRFPVGHPSRAGQSVTTLEQRERKILG
jgi:hypothetical protein